MSTKKFCFQQQKELGGGGQTLPPPACLGLRVPELCSDNKQTDKQR